LISKYKSRDDWQTIVRNANHGHASRTAKRLGIPLDEAKELHRQIKAKVDSDDELEVPVDDVEEEGLRQELGRVRQALRKQRRDQYAARKIREEAFKLAGAPCQPPRWVHEARPLKGSAGTPTLLLSDLHWGEVVREQEVFGLNSYDVTTAQERLRRVIESTVDLLRSHIVSPGGYPGIVVALAGDMVSGGIHPELMATDELPPIAATIDLRDHLVAAIKILADEFGRVFVPCVDGNHDRNTRKPQAKSRAYHSYGWMLYCMLERAFQDDERVTVQVSEETDLLYDCAGLRYLLTHGDSMGVKGGNGIIGALGPIMRGYKKTAASMAAVGRGFDVIVMGHWHQYLALRDVRVNGTLKGYDEYARQQRFHYEPPSQSLWMTHPTHGITISMPVLADEPRKGATGFDSGF
jgi:predicted phosphodiesterase